MEYPAGDFFEDFRERFERLHVSAAGRVTWEIPVTGAVLFVDPELSIHALLELLGNGLQFGAEGGTIAVSAAAAGPGEGVRVTLRQDLPQAPGVPPDRWGHEPLLSTRRGAYGLGLFRVRRILEAQGAALDAAWGGGSLTVTVSLPSPPPAAS